MQWSVRCIASAHPLSIFDNCRTTQHRDDPATKNRIQHNRLLWEADRLLESSRVCPHSANLSTSPNIRPSLIHYKCRFFSPGMITFSPSKPTPVVSCRMHILPNIGPTGWPVDLLRCRTIAISSLQPVQYPSKNAQNSTVRKASHRNLQGQPNAVVVARPCNLPIIVPWFIQQKRTDGGFNLAFMRDTSAIDSRWLGQNRARMERGLKSSWTQHKDGIMMDRLGVL